MAKERKYNINRLFFILQRRIDLVFYIASLVSHVVNIPITHLMSENILVVWHIASTCLYLYMIFFYREIRYSVFFPIAYLELLAYCIFFTLHMNADFGAIYYVITIIPAVYLFNLGVKRYIRRVHLFVLLSSIVAVAIIFYETRQIDIGVSNYIQTITSHKKYFTFHVLWTIMLCASFLIYLSFIVYREIIYTERKNNRVVEKLRFEKDHDPLTKLMNRRSILKILGATQEKKIVDGIDYAVSIFDIDHFKSVNDTYGHATGDEVLKTVSKVLKDYTSENENFQIARWGGEEFLILFTNLTEADLKERKCTNLLEGLRTEMENFSFVQGEISIKITLTFGLATSKETWKTEKLLNIADQRLMHGKKSGRNRVVDSGDYRL